jgi:lipopolysaccharide/colanic/teichoic acid biosynthesis glycosyltransferase
MARSQFIYSYRHSYRKQLVAVLLAAIAAYFIARLLLSGQQDDLGPLHITLGASLFASLLSVTIIGSFYRYPGTEAVSAILPAVSISYGILMAVLLIGRIDYARGMLFGSYLLCCLFLFIQQLVAPAGSRLRVALVQGGAAKRFAIEDIDWIDAECPTATPDNVDAVTVDLRADLSAEWERRLVECALAGIPVYHIKHLQESLTGRVELEHLSETSYGTLSPPEAYIAFKRVLDALLAAVALVLLSPVLVIIAIAVRLDTPGPAIFKQRRVGFRGRTFVLRKFRTMRESKAHEHDRDAAMTREGDARITRVGAFLRKSRLDELPQLINVLRGEMSLIGPRPEAEVLSKWYEQEIPFYRYRHTVLPGVTGWAQISQGHVTDVKDVTSKLHYDFYYIKNISPWMDIMIVVRTIMIMITGHGAR